MLFQNYYYENRWTPETPNARYPRLTTETVQNNTQSSSVWLVDGSFLKLRNCEVYYKLPHSVVNKWHLNSAKLYVRGVDLFCWDHIKEIDPESIGMVFRPHVLLILVCLLAFNFL